MAVSNWKAEIERRLALNGERWSDVLRCTLSDDELAAPFDNGRHGNGGRFFLWTRHNVYFDARIDGYPRCGSAPRDPETRTKGAGTRGAQNAVDLAVPEAMPNAMRLLVTGSAGFIGSHFLRLVLETRPQDSVVCLDALTYSGNLSTLADVNGYPNFQFAPGRIEDPAVVRGLIQAHKITHVVNFAAESHNDRSLLEPSVFLRSNAVGVENLLQITKEQGIDRMLHVSTDEVYGSIPAGRFTEESPLEPNTPYSASKAAGDLVCRAHWITYRTPIVVTRGGNTYGPYQYPEKLIPFFTTRLLQGKPVPVYGDGSQVREWIHARDHASGILAVLQHGAVGQIYNVGDRNERRNMEIVRVLLEETGRDESLIRHIPDPRGAAHDARYSMVTDKIGELGWTPSVEFEEGLRNTVRWYANNEDWWRPITQTQDYQQFVRRYYGPSLGDEL